MTLGRPHLERMNRVIEDGERRLMEQEERIDVLAETGIRPPKPKSFFGR